MFIDMKGKKCESRENANVQTIRQNIQRRTDRQNPSQQRRN